MAKALAASPSPFLCTQTDPTSVLPYLDLLYHHVHISPGPESRSQTRFFSFFNPPLPNPSRNSAGWPSKCVQVHPCVTPTATTAPQASTCSGRLLSHTGLCTPSGRDSVTTAPASPVLSMTVWVHASACAHLPAFSSLQRTFGKWQSLPARKEDQTFLQC